MEGGGYMELEMSRDLGGRHAWFSVLALPLTSLLPGAGDDLFKP